MQRLPEFIISLALTWQRKTSMENLGGWIPKISQCSPRSEESFREEPPNESIYEVVGV